MDFHKLQQQLFEMDPTDPREDLAKLQAQAQGGAASGDAPPTKDYLRESAEVSEGSLGLDRDYSLSDFAALAGVKTEANAFQKGFNSVQKGGALGPDALEKGVSNIFTGDKKSKEKPAAKTTAKPTPQKKQSFFKGEAAKYEDSLNKILADPALKKQFLQLVKQTESMKEGKPKMPKPSNPVAKHMNTYNKASVVPDKKKDAKAGKEKHKKKDYAYESIKEELYRLLDKKG
jgi:hypothetical protein